MTSTAWEHIANLPDSWDDLASEELLTLREIWREHSAALQKRDALNEFNARLAREWAIETGIIERLFSIDRGTTELLIARGIHIDLIEHGTSDKPPQEIVQVLRDHEDTLNGLFDFIKGDRPLSTSYIRELHQALTRHQTTTVAKDSFGKTYRIELLRGEWKKQPNNPTRPDGTIHQYCPPEYVIDEMERLVSHHAAHVRANVPPEVEAAWLHHAFTQVHPFQDGNGRVARSLASLVFIKEDCFPLSIHRDQREQYILALEAADSGKLEPLVALFVRVQLKAFRQALSLSDAALAARETVLVQSVIDDAAKRLRERQQARFEQLKRVFDVSHKLAETTRQQFEESADALASSLRSISSGYSSSVQQSGVDTAHWFKGQIVEIARELGYFANTRTHHDWVRLRIKEERRADIVVSFHCMGTEFYGIMVASAYIQFSDSGESGESTAQSPHMICDDVFQFAYNEDIELIARRFSPWLRETLLVGLEEWRRQL